MPLYEFDEGTSKKFYRIELEGPRVHLHWGRMGTEGERQTLEHASEREAKEEYDRQSRKRRERGYRLVLNEDAPIDPEAAKRERLARTAPLSDNPRFFFTHKKTKSFIWLEARGNDLVTAEGKIGKEADAAQRTESCASPAAAVRKRDAAVGGLLAKGYVLSSFGVAETKKPRPLPKTLKSNPALEAHIREDPFAEDRWAVLEDWLLEQGDLRGEIVRLEKAGARGDAAQTRGAHAPLLLGPKAKVLENQIQPAVWRAGFVQKCKLTMPNRNGAALFEAFLQAPATSLIHSLELLVPLDDFRPHLEALAGWQFVSALRSLTIDFLDWRAPTSDLDLPGSLFASFSNLETLAIRGSRRRLVDLEDLPRQLRRLEYTPSSREEVGKLLVRGALPNLRALSLDIHFLEQEAGIVRQTDESAPALSLELDRLLSLETAPNLEELALPSATDATVKTVLEALVASKLRKRLRTLTFGWVSVPPDVLRAEYGTAFDHLQKLALPHAPPSPP